MTRRTLVVATAGAVFLLHGALATGLLLLARAPRTPLPLDLDAMRVVEKIDAPMMWAIEVALQEYLWRVPWGFHDLDALSTLNAILSHVVLGGGFYALLGAVLAVVLTRRRQG